MKTKKQNPDFLHIGVKLLHWYRSNSRNLPWRNTKNPYNIWICEIILQQTQVKQGLNHYLNFVDRFPTVESLALASIDEVLLYWKGLGYYSRALNLHQAAKMIMENFNGVFPSNYYDILKLKGVGKYTAAAISSICFNENRPAVDGNFYRVLSRIFADDFDISTSSAFNYFSDLAYRIMPKGNTGDFNQAMMDLGSEICKPKNPQCELCPLNLDCVAFQLGKTQDYPRKLKKIKTENLLLQYFFIHHKNQFLIKQRGDGFIWKKLYEFPIEIPDRFHQFDKGNFLIKHKLTHKNLKININVVELTSKEDLKNYSESYGFIICDFDYSKTKSFPKPLENFLEDWAKSNFKS